MDFLSGLGEGIAFSGKAQTFEGLRSRMLGMEQERRKQQDIQLAKLSDFNIGTGRYYPLYAREIAKTKMDFINKLYADIKKYGKDEAINRNWITKQEVIGRIKALEANNQNVDNYIKNTKDLAPRQKQLLEVVTNPDATPQMAIALTDRDAGIAMDENYNFLGDVMPKIDYYAMIDRKRHLYGDMEVKPIKPIGSGFGEVEITRGLPKEEKENLANSMASDLNIINNIKYTRENEVKAKYPILFTQDRTNPEYIEAARSLVFDVLNEELPETKRREVRQLPKETKWEYELKTKGKVAVSGNKVDIGDVVFDVGEKTGKYVPITLNFKTASKLEELKPATWTANQYYTTKRNEKRVVTFDAKTNSFVDESGRKVDAADVKSETISVQGSISHIKYNPETDDVKLYVYSRTGSGNTLREQTYVLDGKRKNEAGETNLSKFRVLYGYDPKEIYKMYKEKSGKERVWTFGGVTAPESEWLKNGWTIDKLKKVAK